MQTTLPKHDIVLLGVGHTNAHVLRKWRMEPIHDARLTCVSNFPIVTYSGMVPGVLAGQYPRQRMEIDLVRLCAAAGARLVVGDVTSIDAKAQRIILADRPSIPFDFLSIGIGSVPTIDGVNVEGEGLLPIKPMQTFLHRLDTRLEQLVQQKPSDQPIHLAVVGGGVGGVEIAFCLRPYLDSHFPDHTFQIRLISAHQDLLGGLEDKTQAVVKQQLEAAGVQLDLGLRVTHVTEGQLTLQDASQRSADVVLWATSAVAPELLRKTGLTLDQRGFVLTHPTLQSVDHDRIFAVGDSGTIDTARTPKAGVYAVRQGPVLWENLQRSLLGLPLKPYRPQKKFLKLINTGTGRSVFEYRKQVTHSGWAWKLKNWIDGRFMDKYQDYRPMEMSDNGFDGDEPIMRCAGCGGKVNGSVLSQALSQLEPGTNDRVMIGLDAPDDAAILKPTNGTPITVTTDFFKAPLDDPYLVGRIAALNATSDVFVMGARPYAALTMASIPVGKPRQQEHLLVELLAGSLHEFRQIDTALVGGHTIEGSDLTLGFTVLAEQTRMPPQTKGCLREGDRLVLTKPLGTGVLLAAHMQAECRADWMQVLLDSMLLGNQLAVALLDEFDVQAMTDVTGFGLANHLLEMLKASQLAAQLQLDRVPVFPGVQEMMGKGIESTLAPGNRNAEAVIECPETKRRQMEYASLFDPQTNGGLLFGVAPEQEERVIKRLIDQGHCSTTAIGTVVQPTDEYLRISIV